MTGSRQSAYGNTSPVFFQAEDGIRDLVRSRGLGDVYKRQIYDSLDGVFLPGGEDIDPTLYEEEPHELLGAVDKERDRTESLLARWALEESKPIMAICRGAQMLLSLIHI